MWEPIYVDELLNAFSSLSPAFLFDINGAVRTYATGECIGISYTCIKLIFAKTVQSEDPKPTSLQDFEDVQKALIQLCRIAFGVCRCNDNATLPNPKIESLPQLRDLIYRLTDEIKKGMWSRLSCCLDCGSHTCMFLAEGDWDTGSERMTTSPQATGLLESACSGGTLESGTIGDSEPEADR